MSPERTPVTARAPANFALSKYWGKSDEAARHPAVPSVSACVLGLEAWAEVSFEPGREGDEAFLMGEPADPNTVARASVVLDAVRERAGISEAARVDAGADFAVAAGLASSAAGFAAMAGAAWAAAGLDRSALTDIAEVARLGSGSACRSVHGGFVAWEPHEGGSRIRPVAPAEHWPLDLCVVEVDTAQKKVSSTEGMRRAALTSPFWQEWVRSAPADAREIEQSILARDIEKLATIAEANCMCMHSTTWTARPPFFYLQERSFEVIGVVLKLRSEGLPCFFTADAGPNVKVFCAPGTGDRVRAALEERLRPGTALRLSGVGAGLRFVPVERP